MRFNEFIDSELAAYTNIKRELVSFDTDISSLVSDISAAYNAENISWDPYWPKWDSFWWKLCFIYETGKIHTVDRTCIETFLTAAENHYIHDFPLYEKDIPKGCDPYRHIMCFCALGTLYKIACAANIDMKHKQTWMYEMILKFQLPDGGYNCDEQAYTKENGKSSIVSTLPVLEALLYSHEPLDNKEMNILNNGAQYILHHRFFRSTSGKIIDNSWKIPVFPRFYFYDILRGLRFIISWAVKTQQKIRYEYIAETIEILCSQKNHRGFFSVNHTHLNTLKNEYNTAFTSIWNKTSPTFFKELSLLLSILQKSGITLLF